MSVSELRINLQQLSERASDLLAGSSDLRDEFNFLVEKGPGDPAMAVARARRLLEVLVVDQYLPHKRLAPPWRKHLKSLKLYKMIEALAEARHVLPGLTALCHAVRLEGNRVLHYAPDYPGEPKRAAVGDAVLATTLQKLFEVAEAFDTGGYSLYASSLPSPLGDMYRRLRESWRPALAGQEEGAFPLFEVLDLLFRSLAQGVLPDWLGRLSRLQADSTLPAQLPPAEEEALRRLRNLGSLQHDGQWLFLPARSTRAWPTAAGRFLLALGQDRPDAEAQRLGRDVIKTLTDVEHDTEALALLERLQRTGSVNTEDQEAARRLRNLYLMTHSTRFLAEADELRLTDLGYYVLGRWKETED